MKKRLLILLILFNLFIPLVYAENETELINETTNETTNESIENILDWMNDYSNKTEDTTVNNDTNNNSNSGEYNAYSILIEDDANLLTDSEKRQLMEDMRPLSKYGNIVFKSVSVNPVNVETFARTYYISKFGHESGSVFVIDMDNRQIAIASYGNNERVITNNKADIITSNVYRYATNQNYYMCAKKAYEQMYTLLEGGKVAEPMRYASNIVLSLVLAFFIGFFRILATSKIKKADQNEVLGGCDIKFIVDNVQGIKTGTHRVYDPPSDSGGGGSSGGGGGGGGGGGSSGSHGF